MRKTIILRINPIRPERTRIERAARVIKNGGTVIFPTETVYGIGANVFDGRACAKIFKIKKRPSDNPLIVHIATMAQLGSVASEVPTRAWRAQKIFWPGPLTLILKKSKKIPEQVTCGLDTVAVRMPSHPIAQALIRTTGVPIAAPSANISTRPSATTAAHVIREFNGRVDMIIDGGNSTFGVESTVINMLPNKTVLLRPGAYTVEELEKSIGRIIIPRTPHNNNDKPIAPGMKYRHYAPKTRLLMAHSTKSLIRYMETHGDVAVLCSRETANKINVKIAAKKIIMLGSEHDLYEIASNLYAAFRELDNSGARIGIIQPFIQKGIGLAIMDRIKKASKH